MKRTLRQGSMLFVIVTFVIVSCFVLVQRRQESIGLGAAGRCEGCGYDLRGLSKRGTCPECGRAYSDSRVIVRPRWRLRRSRLPMWMACAMTLVIFEFAVFPAAYWTAFLSYRTQGFDVHASHYGAGYRELRGNLPEFLILPTSAAVALGPLVTLIGRQGLGLVVLAAALLIAAGSTLALWLLPYL